MLLAVNANRSTLTTIPSPGTSAADGNDVSMNLQRVRSSRATMKSVEEVMGIIPAVHDDGYIVDVGFATARLFKTVFGPRIAESRADEQNVIRHPSFPRRRITLR